MTEPTELYITSADVPEMYDITDNTLLVNALSAPYITLLQRLNGSVELKKVTRRSLLAIVDEIESDPAVGIRLSTKVCRKFAKGKL